MPIIYVQEIKLNFRGEFIMPFRIDVPAPKGGRHVAITQEYQLYLDDKAEYEKTDDYTINNIPYPNYKPTYTPGNGKTTTAGLVLSVTRETINWSIEAPVDQDYTSQKWRNEVYGTAGKAQRAIPVGCVGYYRGTNSLHVKRQHQTIDEAAHNHNHYRFEQEVTPELFEQHVMNFVEFDKESDHNGTSKKGESKFLSEESAKIIIEAFRICYDDEHSLEEKNANYKRNQTPEQEFLKDHFYSYTEKDKLELEQGKKIEGQCRDMTKGLSYTMAGLFAEIADQRQHDRTSIEVKRSRQAYQQREKAIDEARFLRRSSFFRQLSKSEDTKLPPTNSSSDSFELTK